MYYDVKNILYLDVEVDFFVFHVQNHVKYQMKYFENEMEEYLYRK
jgi:hypothetical protein